MARRRLLTSALTATLMVVGLGAAGAGRTAAGVVPSTVAGVVAVPLPIEPKSAFTADNDHVALAGIRYDATTDRFVKDVTPYPGQWPVQTTGTAQHEGEISRPLRQAAVFVSARDNPDGDIYMTDRGRPPTRITCERPAGQKSHPVLSPNGRVVAFANNQNGNWDIWLAYLDSDDPECADSVPLTADPHDDLWPNWIGDSSLVFSSTRDNGLGNIYGAPVSDAPTEEADDQAAVQLTKGPAADTMPLVIARFVVFTTTRFRQDGSLATLPLPDFGALPSDGAAGPVESLWRTPLQGELTPPQSSEAAVIEGAKYLAFSTTDRDPYGDVHIVKIALLEGDRTLSLRALPWTEVAVADQQGVAESHPSWLSQGFGCAEEAGCTATDVLGYTVRSSTAIVDHVNFQDGSGREALPPAPLVPAISPPDAAGPSYSPDGRRLAWSQRVSATMRARQLVVANSDGSDPRYLDYPRGLNDLDVDPVWSPDGTRLAFTRNTYLPGEEGGTYALPAAFVLDLVGSHTGTNVRRASASPTGAPAYSETNPSWAANGRHLAVDRRQVLPAGNLGVFLTLPTPPVVLDTQFEWSVTVKNSGAVQMGPVWLDMYPQAGFAISSTLPDSCHATIESGHYACEVPALPPANAQNDPLAQKTFHFVGYGTSTGPAKVSATISHLPNDNNSLDDSTSASVTVIEEDPVINLCAADGCQDGDGYGTSDGSGTGTSDGSTVPDPVFARYVDDAAGTPSELWVINVEDGTSSPLQNAKACGPNFSIPGRHPTWSPDGTRIAYEDKGALKVARLDPAATLPRIAAVVEPVTGFTEAGTATPSRGVVSVAEDAVWSPDGSEIVFTGQPNGQPDMRGIYGVKPDGTGLRTIAQRPGPETEPSVQPWADQAVAITPTPPDINVTEISTVRVLVTNKGPGLASEIRTVVEIPPGLSLVDSPPPGCTAAPETVTCDSPAPLAPDGTLSFEIKLRALTAGLHVVTATVSAKTPDRDTTNNQASATINSRAPGVTATIDLAVVLAVERGTGWAGGKAAGATVSVTNKGTAAAANVQLTIAVPGFLTVVPDAACAATVCNVGALAPGASKTFHPKLGMPGTGAGTGEVSSVVVSSGTDVNLGNNTAKALFQVLQPRVRLLPAVAQPGKVLLAMLEDMPPGDNVTLVWTKGITSNPDTVPVPGATLTWPMLVVPGDLLGERELVVRSIDGRFGGVAGIKAPLLVVPRTSQPPGFLERR